MNNSSSLGPQAQAEAWLLRRVRVAALLGLFILGGPFLVLFLRSALTGWYALGFGLPFVMPQLVILWRLRGGPESRGLQVAASAGVCALIVFLLILVVLMLVLIPEREYEDPVFWAVIGAYGVAALVQWIQVKNAGARWEVLHPDPSTRPKWRKDAAGLTAYYFVLLVLVGLILPSVMRPERKVANETRAVGSLRTLHTAAHYYQEEYKNGFPPSLAAFGPPETGAGPGCGASDLVDHILASGTKSGYTFEYSPGPPVEKPPPGCTPGGTSYTVSARPKEYGKSGGRSFFTDETGVIRQTSEDRAATAKDPPIS
jgi:hypothetical protein